MTPELLRTVGEAAFGERWQTPLAEALGVRDRTLRYWLAGRDMPDGARAQLKAIAMQRRDRLTAVLRLL